MVLDPGQASTSSWSFFKNMNSGEGLENREPSLRCQWECGLVQPLWRTVWKNVLLCMCFQLLSYVWLFVTPWIAHVRLLCSSLSPGICSNSCLLSRWCYLTVTSSATPFSFCLQSFPPPVFSKQSALCIRWPKNWSFSVIPSNDCSGLISLRIDWFDLLVAQGMLKSLLQHHSSKTSVLWCSVFSIDQLSHPSNLPWFMDQTFQIPKQYCSLQHRSYKGSPPYF